MTPFCYHYIFFDNNTCALQARFDSDWVSVGLAEYEIKNRYLALFPAYFMVVWL